MFLVNVWFRSLRNALAVIGQEVYKVFNLLKHRSLIGYEYGPCLSHVFNVARDPGSISFSH